MLTCSLSSASGQTTFSYTGVVQTYTVGPAVHSLSFDVQGASGGSEGSGLSGAGGGKGGRVQGNLSVAPGSVLYMFVGGRGQGDVPGTALHGGYNGGGGTNGIGLYGGTGGGASDIRTMNDTVTATNRLVVAGGGGGAGLPPAHSLCYSVAGKGGDGGGLIGQTGFYCAPDPTFGGRGGSQSAGGYAAGTLGADSSVIPHAGSLGQGGEIFYAASGAGGGGYYGGGAGADGGGGGGSSYADSTVTTAVVHTQGYDSASDGLIIVSVNCMIGDIIGGSSVLCTSGGPMTLSDTSSGYWSSSNTAVATVGSATGVVTGLLSGTTIISFTKSAGCAITLPITVNPVPANILGGNAICTGTTDTLTDATTGGTWSSGATAIGSISATGILSGITAGVVTVTYTATLYCGSAYAVKTISVNAMPATITGSIGACVGTTTLLSETATGGTWSSSVPSIAIVGSTGIVSGVSGGSDTIRYAFATGCSVYKVLTINLFPSAISGPGNLCSGSAVILSNSISGGMWTSSNPAIATVGSASGNVSGISVGTDTISYTMPGGCFVALPITVNALPAVVMGSIPICVGAATTLMDSLTGGAWSTASSFATIGGTTSPSTIVTGMSAGTAIISYTLPTSCYRTASVTVNALPAAIGGIVSAGICPGQTETLTESGTGIWSTGTGGAASVGSSSGTVTGVSGGAATITFTLPTGCSTTAVVSVNPAPGPITGIASTCTFSASTLADTTHGGIWLSSDYSVANVDTGGVVTGYDIGMATITYMTAAGCMATTTFTTHPAPGAITGVFSLCTGGTVTLSNSVSGGTWSSSDTTKVRVNASTGLLTGVAPGAVTMTYSMGAGCSVSQTINVLPPPTGIIGAGGVCRGSSLTLTETGSGVWSAAGSAVTLSGTTSALSITVTGTSVGTATISYTTAPGCAATAVVTVNPMPAAITGAAAVCSGSTTTLSESGGGVWSAAPLTAGTISGAGVLTGISTGTVTVVYTLPTGCTTSKTITVNALPSAISGPSSVCVGQTITETDGGGGTWSRSNTNANIGSTSGIVTGVAAGPDIITYTLPLTGCYITKTVTVSTTAGSISGAGAVCSGSSITLTDGGAGTWSSGSGAITIAGSTGSPSCVVTGVSAGTAAVTYSIGTGCIATAIITVNPLPLPIAIGSSICPGGSITLTGPTGGVWSSGAGVPIAIGSATGIVTGTTAGTPTITYTLPTGCYRTAMVTINPTPPLPGGPSALCVGAHITLTESGSGTWLSGSTGVATIGTTTGNVTGIATGTSNITFTSTAGCPVTTTITVSLSPANITGPLTVCTGASVSLTDTAGGGLWTSGSSMATIGSLSGTVTGVSAGTVTITYSLGTGCTVTRTETVTASPAAILGAVTLCAGATTPLTETTTGGTWSSTPASVATVSGGTVSGIAAGTAVIDYTAGGCFASDTITVNATPVPITIGSGPAAVCQGATITATDAVPGGTWSTTSSSIMLGSSGSITGVTAGTASITYAIGSTGSLLSCSVTKTITVNPIAAITGATGICVGNTTTLSDAVAGGRWSSSGAGVPITIGSSTGVVTGLSAGVANVTYTTTAGCTANYSVTVNTTPSAIGGTLHVCVGSTTNLSNTAGGGVWTTTSSNIGLGSVSGIVTGITAGIAPVTYSLGTGCTVNAVITVNNLPASITGAMNVCPGGTTTLSESGSGVWESGSLSYATIGTSTGIVTGVSAGPATISFTSALGCVATTIVTVNPLPDAITGTASICEGLTTTLSDATTGGAWSTGSTLIAIGGSASSPSCTVTAISAGTGIVTYTLPTGCATTTSIYVNAAPPPITGATAMCISSGITLSDAAPGGGWTTTSGSAVSVGSSSGVVTGVSLGTAVVSYTLGGCSAVTTVSVTSLPPNISGTAHLCVGITDTLTDAGGGVWTSSNPLIATIGSATGAVVGVIPGTLFISYSLGLGCTVSMPVTVNATPASITGPSLLCAGSAVTLHDATAGGVWSSSNTTLATIGSASSPLSTIVNGASGGTANISYTSIATGCASVYPVAVIQVPAITGTHNICAWGDTMTVYDPLPGGSFTSTLVTVSDSGAVLSYAPGTAVITYTESHGCFATATITVNPLPGEITGSRDICVGATAALSDTSIGGIWSAAPTPAGSISPVGVVAGIATGEVAVTYTTSRYGCSQSMTVSVDASPTSAGTITGSSNVCAGSSITLSNTTIGGIWSATTGGIATIGSATGVVIAITVGAATINYTVSNHCGSVAANKTVTVNADVTPTISISATTDTLCAGSLAHFASVITNGGTAPSYMWRVNGGTTTATGSSYSYTPANGDAVTAMLTSNAQCAVPASVTSNTVTMTVNPQVIPVVVITATPPGTILTGAAKTLTATVSNGGDNPTYQWVLNGVVIPGATDSSYTATTFNDGDTVTCVVISSGVCGGNTAFSNKEGIVVYNNVGIKSLAPKEELAVYPNPNNGAFTIKGAIGNPDEEVSIVITDLLGQEVYRSVAIVSNGMLDAQVQLCKSVAHGMYLVSVHTAAGVMVFHVVVEQ